MNLHTVVAEASNCWQELDEAHRELVALERSDEDVEACYVDLRNAQEYFLRVLSEGALDKVPTVAFNFVTKATALRRAIAQGNAAVSGQSAQRALAIRQYAFNRTA